MRKAVLLLFVALTLAAIPAIAFDDVPPTDTFAADIQWLGDTGITRGCNPPHNTRFCPTQPVTRAQMATFLVRALDLPAATGGPLADVAANNPHRDDIAALAAAGITRGCNPPANTRFCPDQAVTRAQMASFMVRALDLPDATGGPLADVPANNPHRDDISALAAAGITRGCNPPTNSRFCPTQSVTRGQMAAFLRRAVGDRFPNPGDLGTIYGHWDGLGGRAYRLDLDTANPAWEHFLGAPSEFADVVATTNEWVGTTEGAWITENEVGFYDLHTQLENQTLIWPDSGDLERRIKIEMMAASDDGQLIAAKVTEWLDDPHLEVVRRSTGRVVGSGFDENVIANGVTALEWTPSNDLVVGGWASNDGGVTVVPSIGVIPASAVTGSTPYEQVADIHFVLTDPGAGAIQWVALSHDASQILFVERGNVWVAPFRKGATPRQLTTGFWAGASMGPGWTGQFSPDGTQIALASQVSEQFIIPNHTGTAINLGLRENRERYLVGEALVNYIDAWLP